MLAFRRLYTSLSFVIMTCSVSIYVAAAPQHGTSAPAFSQVVPLINQLENTLDGQISVAVLASNQEWSWQYQGQSSVAMMSTFKPFACGKLLSDLEQGKLTQSQRVQIKASQLQAYSPVSRDWLNQPVSYQQACEATLRTSDNTAANIVLEGIGGPVQLTQFFRQIGDNRSRLDDIEPTLNHVAPGELNNTSHALAMVHSLRQLTFGEALSQPSQQQLLAWMKANQVSDNLLRAVLPSGWQIADRSGAGNAGNRGIIAVIWPKAYEPVVMAIYIQHANAEMAQLDQAIADVGQVIFTAMTQ